LFQIPGYDSLRAVVYLHMLHDNALRTSAHAVESQEALL
jgi:hypothetical protein